jgi:glycine cleavage system H protein
MNPAGLHYTQDHLWLAQEGNLTVLGMTHHAQQTLGDITFVELPPVGKALRPHDVLGVVESVKAASEICAPVAGTVAAVNAALDAGPEAINQDPYGGGWLCKLSGVRAADLAGLLTAAQYERQCAGGRK